MYGKWVTLLGKDSSIQCKVYVYCTSDTPDDELQRRALETLHQALNAPVW